MDRRLTLVLVAATVVLVIALAIVRATGSDSSKGSREVQQALAGMVESFNNRQIEPFLAYWTDNGLQAEFALTRDNIRADPQLLFQGPPLEIATVSNMRVAGPRATADVRFGIGLALSSQRFSLVQQGSSWQIDGAIPIETAIPRGVTRVDVQMSEFSYSYDARKVASGKVAFRGENVGKQQHEIAVVRIPNNANVSDLLIRAAQGEEPGGTELVATSNVADPGRQANLVLSDALPPGRYMLICFLPDQNDPQQLAHALKGMVSDFVVVPGNK